MILGSQTSDDSENLLWIIMEPYLQVFNNRIFFFQLVIGVQWLVSDPADVLFNQVEESVIAVLSENNASSTTISPIMTLKEVSAPQSQG